MSGAGIRITAKTREGNQRTISVTNGKYTAEELAEITRHFRKYIKDGGDRDDYIVPVPKGMPSAPKTHFPKGDILKLKLPTNGGCSFLLLGSTRSGKSTAMVEVYEKFFKKHITMLLTHSAHADIYKPLAKSAIICPGFFPELVNEPMKLNSQTKNHYDFCLLFDDLATTGKNDTEMTKLLTIGRNSGMSALISAQRLQMLNASGRANCNYVCLFRLNTDSAIKDVIDTYLRSYLPAGMSMADAIRFYKDTTVDHHFFLVNTLEDTVEICRI